MEALLTRDESFSPSQSPPSATLRRYWLVSLNSRTQSNTIAPSLLKLHASPPGKRGWKPTRPPIIAAAVACTTI